MTLDLAMITHGPQGIERVATVLLPPQPGVRYVVSWQRHENAPIPTALLRPDVEIHRFDGVGLSNNRNNALDHCTADVILIADDDLTYLPGAFDEILRVFRENPGLDFATFRSEKDGNPEFPQSETCLGNRLPKGYYVTSFEMALRRSSAGNLRMCPELGLGAPRYQGGEDEMMLHTAIKRGLDCRFFPLTICRHPHPSTGTKLTVTDGNLRGSGAVIALMNPWSAPLRVPLKAWRTARAGKTSFIRALRHITAGALGAPALFNRNKKYLK